MEAKGSEARLDSPPGPQGGRPEGSAAHPQKTMYCPWGSLKFVWGGLWSRAPSGSNHRSGGRQPPPAPTGCLGGGCTMYTTSKAMSWYTHMHLGKARHVRACVGTAGHTFASGGFSRVYPATPGNRVKYILEHVFVCLGMSGRVWGQSSQAHELEHKHTQIIRCQRKHVFVNVCGHM